MGGRHRDYNWVVKLDPDTVFFPDRLRGILARRRPMSLIRESPELSSMYLNNCEYGLHGPIEVLSRDATSDFILTGLDNGKCDFLLSNAWGEDTFLDHCLRAVG